MNKLASTGKWLFAVAFIVFGMQHFMYRDFVATLVPAWIPWHLFFGLLVGVAFILIAVSLLINKFIKVSALTLALMLFVFIAVIHIPRLVADPMNAQNWTRALQDVAILGTALMLTGDLKFIPAGQYLFAAPMIAHGMQHFAHVKLATGMVPLYFPAAVTWDYLIGGFIVWMAALMLVNRYGGAPALFLGLILLLFALLYHLPPLITNLYDAQHWTGMMLDVAVASGAFISAGLTSVRYKTVNLAA